MNLFSTFSLPNGHQIFISGSVLAVNTIEYIAIYSNFLATNIFTQLYEDIFLSFTTKTKKLELTKHISPHANGQPLLKQSSSHSHSSPVLQRFCLLSGLPTVKVLLLLTRTVPRSTVIMSFFRHIEQNVH